MNKIEINDGKLTVIGGGLVRDVELVVDGKNIGIRGFKEVVVDVSPTNVFIKGVIYCNNYVRHDVHLYDSKIRHSTKPIVVLNGKQLNIEHAYHIEFIFKIGAVIGVKAAYSVSKELLAQI